MKGTTYETVSNGFDYIRNSVDEEQKLERINSDVIQKWSQSVLFVRNQAELLISHLKTAETMFVGRCIVFMTLFLFTMFNIPVKSSSIFFFQIAWGCYATFQLVRLYLKTSQAERITSAEYNLCNQLASIDPTALAPECELKV
ncbi:unnamed protein product [Allacma fusca]|uniref:Uncharacterized protein n=1 Tax=Allacma fusca TaxID=39272 RepID=A0A8J2JUJ3_9HEXA|nr:unnamed protein product [Allacma fusca]